LGQRLSWLFGLLSAGILCGINNAGQMRCGTSRVMTAVTCVLVLDGARAKWNTEKHTHEMEHGKKHETHEQNGTLRNGAALEGRLCVEQVPTLLRRCADIGSDRRAETTELTSFN
jgi:hypothetical protein